jgi:hypothetical protein
MRNAPIIRRITDRRSSDVAKFPLLPVPFRAPAALFRSAALPSMNTHAGDEGRIPGAWRLLSAEYRTLDGAPVDSPWGLQPAGLLMYDSDGNMAAQLGRSERANFAGGDPLRGMHEIRAARKLRYWGARDRRNQAPDRPRVAVAVPELTAAGRCVFTV